jgi:prepilin signal peptidase PulO-like enzyme (type II secretory pathway)
MPMSLLPHVAARPSPPAAGVPVPLPANAQLDGQRLYVEPLSLAAPDGWPAILNGAPQWLSLTIGLACYAVWCFALTPRIWRRRRGAWFGLGVMLSRVARELARPPLAWIAIVGVTGIAATWYRGGAMWVGLLTSLVGLVGGSAMVWTVRIVSSKALHKEALGFGDVTLMMMIGAFLGWQPTILIFFLAPLAALIIGIAQLLLGRGDVIPYGPFLCLATLLVVIRWADFWNAGAGFQAVFFLGWLVPLVLALGVVMLGAMLVIWRNIKESIFHDESE